MANKTHKDVLHNTIRLLTEWAGAGPAGEDIHTETVTMLTSDGGNAALGTTTDAPASTSVAETTTARTGISLWKGIKNLLLEIKGLFTGAVTTPTHSAVNVTTSSGEALAANADRLYALLVNVSDEPIFLKLGADAVVDEGIRLNPNGGSYEMAGAYRNLYRGAVNAIHDGTGNKVLTVLEGV